MTCERKNLWKLLWSWSLIVRNTWNGCFLPLSNIMASKDRKMRKQTYKKEYTEKWPCIVPSGKDDYTVRCELCCCDFGIAHGGSSDITLHISRTKHRTAAAASKGTASIASFFQNRADFSVIRAETLMTNFLIEHNIAFSAADHLTDLLKLMFPDSNIASKFASRRSKSTSIARTLGQEAKGRCIFTNFSVKSENFE